MNENDTLKTINASLSANVLRIGDECRSLADENARLKAEVERLRKAAVTGGYNLSEYIRMANSETLEFDNGDIFAEMTLPERIKYIVESHARLKAEVERLRASSFVTAVPVEEYEKLKAEVNYLKAENERLQNNCNYLDRELDREIDKTAMLCGQVERLRKAGDAMYKELLICGVSMEFMGGMTRGMVGWNAAKDGKPNE